MDSDKEIVQSLITGGIIGAALGALLSKSKETGVALGALAGAAILATFKANEAAKKTNITMFIEENNALYEIKADGSKHFVKNIEKPTKKLPQTFKLS
jgi:hypothetical protein